jgi:TP901 family phage tail tape measure protein
MATDQVIQGSADLDISPFLAKLAQLEAAVNASVANIGLSMQRMAATATTAVNGMQSATVATGQAATQVGRQSVRVANAARQSMQQVNMAVAGIPKELRGPLEHLKRVEDALNSIYRAGAQLSQVSMTTALMGGAFLGLEAAAIRSAGGVDFWSAKTIAAAKAAGDFMQGNLAAQKEAMAELPEMIRNVAVDTGQSAEEIAASMFRWQAASGAQVRTLNELYAQVKQVETIIKAATIADADHEGAIRGVVQILGAYGMSVGEAARVTEVLSNTAQVTNAEFAELIESSKMGAAAAARLSIPFEEFIGTLGKLSDVGQRGTQAGRGLQQFLQQLVDPSNEASGALQAVLADMAELGDNWRDILFPGGQFVGLMDKFNQDGTRQLGIIGLLSKATENLTQADKEQFFAKITTQNAYRVLSPLIEQYRRDTMAATLAATTGAKAEVMSLEELVKTLTDAGIRQQSFADQWDIIADTINVKWGKEMERLNAGIGALGTTASGALLPLVHAVGTVVLALREWGLENPKLFSQILSGMTIFAGLSVVIGTVGFFLGQMIQGFTSLFIMFRAGFGVIGSLLGHLGGIVPGITLIVAAILALSVAFRNNFLGMQSFVGSVATALKDVLATVLNTVVGMVKVISALFSGDWDAAWESFKDIVITILALVSLYFRKFTQEIQGWGVNIVAALATGMLQGASSVLTGVLTMIGNIIASFFKGMSPPREGPLSTIDRWGEGVMAAYGEGLRKGADKHIKSAAEHAAKQMGKPLEGHSPPKEGPLTDIKEWAANIANAYAAGLKDAADKEVRPAAEEIAKTISEVVADASEKSDDKLRTLPAALQGMVASVRQSASDLKMLPGAMEAMGASVANVATKIANASSLVARGAQEMSLAGTALMDSLLRGLKKADFGVLNEMANTVSTYLKNLLSDKKISPAAFLGDMSEVRTILAGVFSTIRAGGNLAADAFNRVKQIVGSIGDDLENVVAAYADVVRNEERVADLKKSQDWVKTYKEENYGPRLDALEEETKDLEIQKYQWTEKKQKIEDAVDALNRMKWPLEDELLAIQDSTAAWQEKIDAIESTKQPIQDIVDALQDEIDAHRQIAEGIREELDLVQEKNDAEQDALQDKLDQANDALSNKRKEDKREEEVLERRIAEYRARGAAPYYINKLEEQLRKLKNQHEDENQGLEDAKDAAEDELDKARKKAKIEEDAIEKRLRAVEKDIAADEKRLKIEQNKLRVLDRQEAVLQKEMDKESRREKNIQREMDAIDRRAKLLDRENRVPDDQIKAIDRRQGAIAQEERLIEQQSRPLTNQIELLDKKIAAAELELKAAQDRYDIEKAILDWHEKDRADAQAAANASKGSNGFNPQEGDPEDGTGPLKGLQDALEEFKSKLKDAMHIMSPELEEERKRIKAQFEAMGEDIKSALSGAFLVGGLVVFRGQLLGLAGTVGTVVAAFRAAGAGGPNFIERIGLALNAPWLTRLGTLGASIGSIASVLSKVSIVAGLVISVFSALQNNTLGVTDAFQKVTDIVGKGIGESLTKVINNIGDALNRFLEVFTGSSDKAANFAAVMDLLGMSLNIVGGVLGNVANIIISVLGGALTFVIEIVGTFATAFIDVFTVMFTVIRDIFSGNWDKIGEAVKTWLTNLIGGFFDAFNSLARVISEALGAVFDAIGKWLKKIFGSGLIGDWFDSLKEAWGNFWSKTIPDAISDGLNAVLTTARNILNSVKETIEGIVGGIVTVIGNILGTDDSTGLRSVWKNAFEGIKDFLFGGDGIVTRIHDLFIGPDGIVTKMVNAAKDLLGEETGLGKIFRTAFDNIKSAVNTVMQPIRDFIKLVEDAINAAKNLPGVQGIADILGNVGNTGSPYDPTKDPLNRKHSGGFVGPDEQLAILQTGEYVLSRRDVARLTQALGANWLNRLGTGLASIQNGSMNPVPAAVAPTVFNLNVGTLVADDRSLKQLEGTLKRFRDVRTGRINSL